MKYLPSLLEYSPQGLEQKLEFCKNHFPLIQSISQSKASFPFHLDFVLPQFAKDRSVMASLGPETVFNLLTSHFANASLDLSIHLMGTMEDIEQVFTFFTNHEFNKNWRYEIYLPPQFDSWWIEAFDQQATIGIWYDKQEWESVDFEHGGYYLLMSVVAGKSGQKRDEFTTQSLITIVTNNPYTYFIADGGWGIDEQNLPSNLRLVSYSSFWKAVGLG